MNRPGPEISLPRSESPVGARWRLAAVAVALAIALGGALTVFSPSFLRLLISSLSDWWQRAPDPSWTEKLRTVGWEALGAGLLVALIASMADRWAEPLSRLGRSPRALGWAGGALLLALWLPVVLAGRSESIAGERYWWLYDDGMVSMQYGRNLAHGDGLVWNPGERVEGYSNFLWTLFMGAVHRFPLPDSKTSLVVLLANLALAVAALSALAGLARSLGGGGLAAAAAGLGVVFSRDTLFWAAAGLEPVLVMLMVAVASWRIVRDSETGEWRLATFLWIAALPLARADGVVLSGLLFALAWGLGPRRGRVAALALLSLALPAAHFLFRYAYYGDILPNTAYLKASQWAGRYQAGGRYVVEFFAQYGILFLFAVFGLVRAPRRARLGIACLVALYFAYVVYVGGDAFQNFRFLLPILPPLIVLAFLGVESIPAPAGARVALVAVTLLPLAVPGLVKAVSRNKSEVANIRMGLLIQANTPPRCRVAEFYAGSVIYFSRRPGLDLLGKTDRHVARGPAFPGARKPGHNKFDYDYSLGKLKPDLVVANFRLPDDEPTLEQQSRGDLAFTGQLYLNPLFREHCLPHPVPADTWRTIFACDWSVEAARVNEWRPVPG